MIGVVILMVGLAVTAAWVFNQGDATLRDFPTPEPEELDDDGDSLHDNLHGEDEHC